MTAPAHVKETADDPSVTPDPVVETEDERRTRLSVYHEIKRLLVTEGIPEHEIAFVHDYEGPAAQAELSRKLNAGEIRIVLASTTKLGVGANIQQRLYAIHHGDPPWVPASIEQRDGRMLRCPFTDKLARLTRYASNSTSPFYASMEFGNLAGPTQGTFAIRFLISLASLGSPDLSAISKRYCRTDLIALT